MPDNLDPDSDGDGIADAEESTGDSDSDGIPDYLEDNTKDTDSDGLPDALDPDSGGGTDEFGGGIVFADYGEEPDGDPTGLQPTGLSTVGNKRYRLETGECGTPDFVSQRPNKVNPYAPEGDFCGAP